MKRAVCIVTTGQPSTNPRAVKEADALAAAGYDVRFVGGHWADWADQTDRQLMAGRAWTPELVRWRRREAPSTFWITRVRHRIARSASGWPGLGASLLPAAGSRIGPELSRLARVRPASLFIAHNIGALPAAAAAARAWRAALGFDAEDFHSGQFADADRSAERRATERIERRWIPGCDYVTAASPAIAAAYAELCAHPAVVVRNVFPRADRPATPPAGSTDGTLRLYWFSQTIGPDRGLEDVVRAMGLVAHVPLELHLRGSWHGRYEQALTSLAREAGVPPGRMVTHPPGDPREMVRLAARYDVGLAPEPGHTRNNNRLQSNKLYVYLLAGLPVLASDTDGNRELLGEASGSGWLIPRRDAQAIANLLARLADRPAEVRAAAAKAWAWGETRFNWDLEQRVFLREVDRAIASTNRPRVM